MYKPHYKKHLAFTYVELLVIITVIGIMAAMITLSIGQSIVTNTMTSIDSEIQTALQSARLSAINTGAPHRVTFDPDNFGILVERKRLSVDLTGATVAKADVEAGGNWEVMSHPIRTNQEYRLTLYDEERYKEFYLYECDMGGDYVIVFDSTGIPDSGGVLKVRFGERWFLSQALDVLHTVDSQTGVVSAEYIAN